MLERIAVAVMVAAAMFVAGDWYGAGRVNAEWDIDKAVKAEAARIATERTDEALEKGRIQREQDKKRIAYLSAHPAERVLLPCASGEVAQAAGSGLQPTSSGSATNTAQSALDDAKRGMEQDAAEWGEAIAVCRVMQNYIKSLP